MADTTNDLNSLTKSLGADFPVLPVSKGKKPVSSQEYSDTLIKIAPEKIKAIEAMGTAEQKQKEIQAGGKRKVTEDYAKVAHEDTEKYDKEFEKLKQPEFAPTKENAQSLGELFSLVATMGVMLGGSGKMAAQGAMDAMTGMLKGWQSGRKDLYERQLKEYDKETKRIDSERTALTNKLSRLSQLRLTDKEAAYALQEEIAAQFPGVIAASVRNQSIDVLYKMVESLQKLASSRETKEETSKLRTDLAAIKAAGGGMASQKAKSLLKSGDQALFINEQTGANLSRKDAEEVSLAALSVGHAYSLLGKVQEHPEWIGRSGQIKQFFNRYVDSLNNNKPLPADDPSLASDKSGQEALVFAKDYAAYLVNYERSIAGGTRGFTVQFQKRFNDLLNQNQFNASGFNNLMNQQIDEISRTAVAKSPEKLNKNNITKMGMIVYGDDPYALKAYQGIQKNTSDQKVASKLDVEETAKANNITVEEAKKRLKAKNFKIEGE